MREASFLEVRGESGFMRYSVEDLDYITTNLADVTRLDPAFNPHGKDENPIRRDFC